LAQPASTINVQVFGSRKSADTRKALRFFAERRIKVHFVDFAERGPSPGELRRFIDRFGIESLVDHASRRFTDRGLAHSRYGDSWWESKLVDEPLLLRMPLVRNGGRLTVGLMEGEWRTWLGD
jgi:arsenate reductase-like glutaredoxin family protein